MQIDSIIRLLQTIKTHYYNFRIILYDLFTDADIEGSPRKIQPCVFTGPGKFLFGQNVTLGYWPSPYFWNTYCHFDTRDAESVVVVGSDVAISNNFYCAVYGKISIGDGALIGPNVVMMDFDGHELDPSSRRKSAGNQKNITIGKNVWIGANTIVLKGVTIGDNSVVSAGSIVVKSIPPNVVAAGNPCQVIKNLNETS